MKKNTKRLLSLMLSLILVVGMIPGTMTAYAAGTSGGGITLSGDLSDWNIKISDEGVLSWDAQASATKYELEFYEGVADAYTKVFMGDLTTNSCDLKAAFEAKKIEHNEFYLSIKALKGTTLVGSTVSTGGTPDIRVQYMSSLPKLSEPQKLKHDATGQSWDSVPGATGYIFNLYDADGNNKARNIETDKTALNFYKEDGWWFTVQATADGYRNSNAAESPKYGEEVVTPPATTYTVEAYEFPLNSGTITGAGTYNAGDTVTLTATVTKEGYKFKEWRNETNTVVLSTNPTYTFTVNENTAVLAVFEKATTKYTVEAYEFPLNSGTITGAGTYNAGDTVTLTATVTKEGYQFKEWRNETNTVVLSTNPTYTFTVNENTAVLAVFEKAETPAPTEYDITVTGGTASANKAVAGTVITLSVDESAIPAGKVFDKWEVVSGGVTITDGKFTMPTNAVEIEATYKDAPFSHTCDIKPVAKDEPSCTEGGKEAYYKCEGCGRCYEDALGAKEITDIDAWGNLEKLGHTESDWKSDKDNHWKECTVTACGVIIEDSKTAHKDDNKDGKCDVCEYNVGVPGDSSDDDKPSDNPQTDDNSMIWLWCALLFVSGAGVVATVYSKKRSSVK